MSKNVMGTIKELLSPDQLKLFESAVDALVDDRVATEVKEIVALKEKQLEKKYEKLSESYVAKQLSIRENKIKATLCTEYDKKLVNLEEKLSIQLSNFLDSQINEQISDEVIKELAINETLAPVIKGIKKIFNTNHMVLESSASDKIKKIENELESTKKQLSESIKDKLKTEQALSQTAGYLVISEKTQGLNQKDKAEMLEKYEGKNFKFISESIDKDISTRLKLNKLEENAQPKTKPKVQNMLSEQSEPITKLPSVPKTNETEDIIRLANNLF